MRIFSGFFVLFVLSVFDFNRGFSGDGWIEGPRPDIQEFLKKYPAYQDIIVKNEVVVRGTSFCSTRYELIRPILDSYNRKFSVLDIGAMEGYFSFRIAEDYDSYCTMIEGGSEENKKKLYWYAQEKLYNLCHYNSHLNNIELLAHRLTIPSLTAFKNSEHFDVVLAFLVVHLMAADEEGNIDINRLKNYVSLILELGNDVIFETSVDVYAQVDNFMNKFCKEKGGIYLGELPRTIALEQGSKGRYYWFRKSNRREDNSAIGVSSETFEKFNGIYPVK